MKEREEFMDTYRKSAIISLVAGGVSASLGVAFVDLQYTAFEVAIHDFFMVLPRSIIIGGLPSLIFAAIVLTVWRKFGKSEKGMQFTCLLIGVVTGAFCTMPLIISYGT